MKIIVTHTSPDWDAIGSVWLIKKYLAGWQEAAVEFVPAGQRLERLGNKRLAFSEEENRTRAIQHFENNEIIHVDTGMGPLDHHQTSDQTVCGTSRTWDFVRSELEGANEKLTPEHEEAVDRIVKIIVGIDHFREVFWAEPTADYQEFSLIGVLEGLKQYKQNQDDYYVEFGRECLNALVDEFVNRIWAEREIADKGKLFSSRWGRSIGFETLNDTVLKLSQKMGYILVLRKDPRKGYVRIKLRPDEVKGSEGTNEKKQGDLTLAYEKLSKIDPDATWYLHVSKKMLLNGTPKNPKMKPTKLSLDEIIKVLESI